MNDNPYASPKTYGERRRIDWDHADAIAFAWSALWSALGIAAIAYRFWSAL